MKNSLYVFYADTSPCIYVDDSFLYFSFDNNLPPSKFFKNSKTLNGIILYQAWDGMQHAKQKG